MESNELKTLLILSLLLLSTASAESLDPPTFYYELNAQTITANDIVSSNMTSTNGLLSISLTEAPGTQCDVWLDWYLDDKTTSFQSTYFANQSATVDVNRSISVLSRWARVNVLSKATQAHTLAVYGTHGGEK